MAGVSKKKPSAEKLFTNCMRREFAQHPEEVLRMVQALFHKAKCGDLNALKLCFEYMDGKPHQSIEMDVEVHDDNLSTASESELLQALRNRMAGILPKRAVSSVDGGGEPGAGSDSKTH